MCCNCAESPMRPIFTLNWGFDVAFGSEFDSTCGVPEPWQCLYFSPLPQRQGSFLPIFLAFLDFPPAKFVNASSLFQLQNLPHPRPRRNVPRTSSSLLKPFMEGTEFHGVLDRRISRQDANREVLADVLNPSALADRPQPERDGFIEAFGADFGAVLDSFCIPDADAARTDCHGRRVAYSPYIRYSRWGRAKNHS